MDNLRGFAASFIEKETKLKQHTTKIHGDIEEDGYTLCWVTSEAVEAVLKGNHSSTSFEAKNEKEIRAVFTPGSLVVVARDLDDRDHWFCVITSQKESLLIESNNDNNMLLSVSLGSTKEVIDSLKFDVKNHTYLLEVYKQRLVANEYTIDNYLCGKR
jgi:hypothetical protein